jgi:hypothetical protein
MKRSVKLHATGLVRRVTLGVVVLAGTAALTLTGVPAASAATPPPTLPGTSISLDASSCPANIVDGDSGSCVTAL